MPNGNPPANNSADSSRFEYKLQWMEAFLQHAEKLMLQHKNVVLAGDFNVILTKKVVFNPEMFAGNALYRPEVWQRLHRLACKNRLHFWLHRYRALHRFDELFYRTE